MSIKYFKQVDKQFEHITLEEFNLLERLRKQKVKDMEEDEKQRREEEMGEYSPKSQFFVPKRRFK